ncbi:uncharacterized protein LOC127812188 [Diospyros lotus]|uniref:uncharacterized protein LOC127812188 n=1 Tax=Diospyros lotus TaxID=55363 RepID=UPI002259558F|nr:uncharacterized protein LOC127812188 [Diospyros lotus]
MASSGGESAAAGRAAVGTSINTSRCPSFLKRVCLDKWWLIKVEPDSKGRTLGVAGFASRERQASRVFHSAAIARRHDAVTLETADGITITITGFINRSLTIENSFPPEACNHFLFGFPYYWEEYSCQSLDEELVYKTISSRTSTLDAFHLSSHDGTNCLPLMSLDNLPVTRIRDLLMSRLGDSDDSVISKGILNDILQKHDSTASKDDDAPVQSNVQGKFCGLDGILSNSSKKMDKQRTRDNYVIDPVTSNSVHSRTPKHHKRTMMKQKNNDDSGSVDSRDVGMEEFQTVIPECEMDMDANSSSRKVARRIMARLDNHSDKGNISLNTSATHRVAQPLYATEPRRYQNRWIEKRGNASSAGQEIELCYEGVEAKETPNSSLRISSMRESLNGQFFTLGSSKNKCGAAVPRRNDSDSRHGNISLEEKAGKPIPHRAPARRSNRQRNIKK